MNGEGSPHLYMDPNLYLPFALLAIAAVGVIGSTVLAFVSASRWRRRV